MSILNVDKIQPIGGGSTITVDATDIQASTGTIRASTFSGDVSATGIGVTSLSVAGVTTFTGHIDASGDVYISDKIIHAGDTNTQIRFHADDKFRIELGGLTNAFSGLKSTSGAAHAKFGINVTTPAAALHIDEAYNHQGLIRVTNGNQNSGYYHQLEMSGTNNIFTLWRHFDGSSFNNTHIHGSTRHAWYISGNEKVRIDSSGNVGIGTDNPNNPLTIHGSGNHIFLKDTATDNVFQMRHQGGTAQFNTYGTGGARRDYVFNQYAAEVLRIKSDGKVGIGTNNPAFELDLRKTGQADLLIGSYNAGGARLMLDGDSNGDGSGGDFSEIMADTGGDLTINARNPASDAEMIFKTGGGTEKLRITSDGTVIFANKLTNSSSFTSHNTNFYGGDVNTGGVRIELAHDTTTVSGNTASGAFPHHLLLSNYSGNTSADNRMCSIGFDIPTTSTHANATIAYQATAAGTGDLQFWLESGNSVYERIRFTSSGQLLISGNTGWNESSSLLSISTDAAAGANMLSNSSAIYNHNNPAFIHVQNRYNTGTGQEAGIIFHSRSSHNGCWAIYGKRTSSSYLSDLIFRNRTGGSSSSERMKITSDGYSKHTSGGGYDSYAKAVTAHEFRQYINSSTLWTSNTNTSQTWEVIRADSARSATNAMNMITTTTGNLGDDQHRLIGNGDILCDGTAGAGAADYAEYFEWTDGNSLNEDRRGMTVVLVDGKVRKTTSSDSADNVIGVVSANPVVVGDAQWRHWQSKYLRDDYGNYIYEDHNQITWTDDNGVKHDYEDWNVPSDITVPNVGVTTTTHDENGVKLQHQKLNPSYDASKTYIPRSERKEWDAIGMVGKLRVRKGQITGTRWIKMKDISDNVEEWLVR